MAPGAWKRGIATLPVDYSILERGAPLRDDARRIIECLERGEDISDHAILARKLEKINAASAELAEEVRLATAFWLDRGKVVGLVGGDHSAPLGLLKALGSRYGDGADGGLGVSGISSGSGFGVLHLDAHCDLRERYEGFDHSHASIMFNALREVPQIEKLVQVGVRDFSETELLFAEADPRVVQFTGADLAEAGFEGVTWAEQCDRIVAELPRRVYVSFDIDFLSPEFCPGTGTPVPGGRTFDEAVYLLRRVVDSGRRIVGFDLCEVAPGSMMSSGMRDIPTIFTSAVPRVGIDAVVGARILFALCGQALRESVG
jgi:agmatinase